MPVLQKILLVEDDPDIQDIARMALEAIGRFTVHGCTSGSRALAEGPAFAPDLVLLDVMMPELDGPQTLRAMRQVPALAQVPVIFLTAGGHGLDMDELASLGAIGRLAKPFHAATLSAAIRQLYEAAVPPDA